MGVIDSLTWLYWQDRFKAVQQIVDGVERTVHIRVDKIVEPHSEEWYRLQEISDRLQSISSDLQEVVPLCADKKEES